MKKFFKILLLFCLFFTINNSAISQEIDENKKLLKIGVLLPLSGEYEVLGNSFLKAIQLALYDISNDKVIIYPKDSKANSLDAYKSAKNFEREGIKIVIGPIFHESLGKLNEINNITFISMTNKTENIPKNTIAFGVNIESQMDVLKKYVIMHPIKNHVKVMKYMLLNVIGII